MDLSDLMGRYCDGDERAFRLLYDTVAKRLLHYAESILRDRAAAEDALQRTFIRLHEARAVYVRDANPLPWLYTITRRLCLDELRRRKRPDRMLAPDGLDSASDVMSGMTMRALEQLTEPQRTALMLTTLGGFTHAEAAAMLGTTASAIKLRAHRAYDKLRALVQRGSVVAV
jgi:RNA polymerase sigma-70 factor (ECF subfamily)